MRQYIGARYVPAFLGEWNSSRSYEPLSIVTYQRASYTSKKTVPAGTPVSNAEYWVQTSDYSAQVQQAIDTANAASSTASSANSTASQANSTASQANSTANAANNTANQALTTAQEALLGAKKKYLFIGDSYQLGTGNQGVSWLDIMAEARGWTVNTDFYRRQNGGAGFTRAGNTFQTLLEAAYTAMGAANARKVTHVVVTGGYNDQYAVSSIPAAIEAFKTRMATLFPNAELLLFPVGFTTTSTHDAVVSAIDQWVIAGADKGASVFVGARNVMKNGALFYTDGVHPNRNGYELLARYIGNALAGSTADEFLTGVNTATLDGVWHNGTGASGDISAMPKTVGLVREQIGGKVRYTRAPVVRYRPETPQTVTLNGGDIFTMTLANDDLANSVSNFMVTGTAVFVDTSNNNTAIPCTWVASNNKVRFRAIMLDANGYVSIPNVTSIWASNINLEAYYL